MIHGASILHGFGIGALMLLCSCAAKPATPPNASPKPAPSAKLTLLRIEPEHEEGEVQIFHRGEMLAVLGNHSFVTFEFPAGSHRLTFNWEETPVQFEEELVIDPAEKTHRFLSLLHKFDVPEISKRAAGTDYTMEETLLLYELPEKYALNLMKELEPDYSFVFSQPQYK
jgi:hypothetical protein